MLPLLFEKSEQSCCMLMLIFICIHVHQGFVCALEVYINERVGNVVDVGVFTEYLINDNQLISLIWGEEEIVAIELWESVPVFYYIFCSFRMFDKVGDWEILQSKRFFSFVFVR